MWCPGLPHLQALLLLPAPTPKALLSGKTSPPSTSWEPPAHLTCSQCGHHPAYSPRTHLFWYSFFRSLNLVPSGHLVLAPSGKAQPWRSPAGCGLWVWAWAAVHSWRASHPVRVVPSCSLVIRTPCGVSHCLADSSPRLGGLSSSAPQWLFSSVHSTGISWVHSWSLGSRGSRKAISKQTKLDSVKWCAAHQAGCCAGWLRPASLAQLETSLPFTSSHVPAFWVTEKKDGFRREIPHVPGLHPTSILGFSLPARMEKMSFFLKASSLTYFVDLILFQLIMGSHRLALISFVCYPDLSAGFFSSRFRWLRFPAFGDTVLPTTPLEGSRPVLHLECTPWNGMEWGGISCFISRHTLGSCIVVISNIRRGESSPENTRRS